MKVFISSVRRGLEEERDALPGLITAIGHEPLAFEDFTTQPVPPRQACVNGVAAADAYLLLIGPNYGHRFDDTGQSPTHDEWVASQTAGIPKMVFLKEGVTLEDDQKTFYDSISNYTTGVFYNSYTTTADLLTKATAAIRSLENAPGTLTWSPLPTPVTPAWRRDFDPHIESNYSASRAQVEVHVLAQPAQPAQTRSARQMTDLATALPARVRNAGVADDTRPVHLDRPADGSIVITVPPGPDTRNSSMQRVYAADITGIRVAPDGQVSIWGALPGDSMGAVIDVDDLTNQIGGMLGDIGALNVVNADTVAIAVGIDNASMLSPGKVADLPRSQSFPILVNDRPIHVHPDELVSIVALGAGASEAARPVAQALVDAVVRPGR